MDNIGKRLREFREKNLNLSRAKFVEGLGITTKTLESYEKGDTPPNSDFLQKLWTKHHLQGLDLDWLITGLKSEPYLPDDFVRVPMFSFEPKGTNKDFTAKESSGSAFIFNKDWLAKSIKANPEDLDLIEIEGDGMAPTLNPGDMALISRHEGQPLTDSIYLMEMEGTLFFKRLQRIPGNMLRITCDNPVFQPFDIKADTIGKDVKIIGRLVWGCKRY